MNSTIGVNAVHFAQVKPSLLLKHISRASLAVTHAPANRRSRYERDRHSMLYIHRHAHTILSGYADGLRTVTGITYYASRVFYAHNALFTKVSLF